MKKFLPVIQWKICLNKVTNIHKKFVLFFILFLYLVASEHKLLAKTCSLYTESGVKVSNDRVLASLQERNLLYVLKGVRSTETGEAERNIDIVDEIDINTTEVKQLLYLPFVSV